MTYQELQLPHGTPTDLERLVRKQLDLLLADVHSMLRLPVEGNPGLEAGCNFSAALVLLEIVGGVSVKLYHNPKLSNLDQREERGERFIQVLERHFPWDDERTLLGAITDRHAAELLYEAFRNPLAHSLGSYDGPYLGSIKVAKGPLSDQQIIKIEQAEIRPQFFTMPTLRTDSRSKERRTKTVLTVKCLYWGVRRMVWNLLEQCSTNVVQGPATDFTTTYAAKQTTAIEDTAVATNVTSDGPTRPGDDT